MPADIHYWETVKAELVVLPVIAAEAFFRNSIAAVAAALLPGAVFRLPAMRTIALPSNLLPALLIRTASLCRPTVLLLTLLMLLVLLAPGL